MKIFNAKSQTEFSINGILIKCSYHFSLKLMKFDNLISKLHKGAITDMTSFKCLNIKINNIN